MKLWILINTVNTDVLAPTKVVINSKLLCVTMIYTFDKNELLPSRKMAKQDNKNNTSAAKWMVPEGTIIRCIVVAMVMDAYAVANTYEDGDGMMEVDKEWHEKEDRQGILVLIMKWQQ